MTAKPQANSSSPNKLRDEYDDGLGYVLDERGRVTPVDPRRARRLSRLLDDVEKTVRRHELKKLGL